MALLRKRIDHLIQNSPYAEPMRFWRYHRDRQGFELVEGERRPAGYVRATAGSRAHDDPGVFVALPLVNQIRERVNAWRATGYPGSLTGTTRRLLEHWHDPQQREPDRRLFFCQLEAIETLIWLAEADPAERQGIEIPGDGGALRRLCTKLATGTGKTVVMAMLIAWQALNKAANPGDSRFTKNWLIVAPGLTVKSRLGVLVPDSAGNFYDEFRIIPPGEDEALRQARVVILNWHKLEWDTEAKLAKKRSVDKRGPKSDEAYVAGVLKGNAGARNWAVVNDEVRSPRLIRRIADYMRRTGTVKEYLTFVQAVWNHPEQVYADVNAALFESLLRVEPDKTDAATIRTLASGALKQSLDIAGLERCKAVAPLLILRFGDYRSFPLLRSGFAGDNDRESERACAIVYAGANAGRAGEVRKAAGTRLHNHLALLVKMFDAISEYDVPPPRWNLRADPLFDPVSKSKHLDMRGLVALRLLGLNTKPTVKAWLGAKKKQLLAQPLSAFDRAVVIRLWPK